MILVAIAASTFISTMLGGLFALRLKDRLHLILGFSAGAVVAVAFFDLMPEALELGEKNHNISTVVSIIALGFLAYLFLDRFLSFHTHHDEEEHKAVVRGNAGAGTLSFHSFLDGVGIGLAFQVSPAVGLIVAIAVLTHDFSDGINTVNYIIKNGGDKMQALRWLLVDAIAPVLGVIATLFVSVSEDTLGLVLALFCGFFLYLGASDLVPESHHAHPTMWTTVMTILGAAVLFGAVRLAGL
jgi:zinc transporter ZupT